MQTILVTGAGGYIGTHMTKRLLKEGFRVIAFDNFSRGFLEPLEVISKYGDLQICKGDLRNEGDLQNLFGGEKIDAVMHFAALCNVNESMQNKDLYFANNVQGTINLLKAMEAQKVRKLIFSSSCAVYGNARSLPITETHKTLPVNPYGESKLQAEQVIDKSSRLSGLKYVILRYFNVCGADLDGEIGDSKKPSELLVQNAVRGALGIEPFSLTCPEVSTPDGTPIRDYVDVLDIVEAHMKALKHLKEDGESTTLNIGTGKGFSVKEIIQTVEQVIGVNFEIKKSLQQREGESPELYASTEKAGEILAWTPQKTLRESILSLKKWYEKNPWGFPGKNSPASA